MHSIRQQLADIPETRRENGFMRTRKENAAFKLIGSINVGTRHDTSHRREWATIH